MQLIDKSSMRLWKFKHWGCNKFTRFIQWSNKVTSLEFNQITNQIIIYMYMSRNITLINGEF